MNVNISCPRKFLPKQKLVLDKSKKYKYILYSGAYGAGKTLLLSHVVIRECIKHPKSLWFVGAQTIPMLRDTVLRTFLEEIELYQDALNESKVDLQIKDNFRIQRMTFTFFNGSEVIFRSCDEPSKFKSLNLDGFALDEPVDIDEEVFKMLQGRLRGNHTNHRFAVMTGNPAGKTNWVYQRYYENPTKDYFVVNTTSFDNTFLPQDYIQNMVESYDEDYKRRYLYGKWGSFEGQVYKDFSYAKHVGDFRGRRYKYYIAGFDDGYRNPCCILTAGVDSDNVLYIVDEWYETQKVDSEKIKEVKRRHRNTPYHKVYVDPSAINIVEALKEEKIRAVGADNIVESGIAKLKSLFRNDKVFIDRTCKNLIREIESYRYDKDSFTRNLTERPVKKNDHGVDSLRYLITDFNPFKRPTFCGVGKWLK